ncbi:MAG: dihydrodipicolinate synthase family protein [Marinilabiliaceae bacterium]|nr:dihydrodipicolinate synthase family protein [Marinilabiliaceae bacterium]
MTTTSFGKKPLTGIVPPMVTPLNSIDSLDIEGTEKLVEHILSAPVSGLFILGTTGEFSSISYKLRHELIEKVCKQVNGRVPVLVGITDTSIIESVNLANKAADCGADAVVSAPPFYYAAAQPELIEYYHNLAPRLPLPLYLYNMPVHTKVMIDPNTVKKISEVKNVIGLKDSSANAVYLNLVRHAMKDVEGFEIFVGPEEMTAEMVMMGANGGVNGGANMFPQLYVDMFNAAVNRDIEKLKPIQEKILEISATIYTVGRYGSSYLKGVKTVLNLMGICNDFIADPFHRFRKEERDIIRKNLLSLGIEGLVE